MAGAHSRRRLLWKVTCAVLLSLLPGLLALAGRADTLKFLSDLEATQAAAGLGDRFHRLRAELSWDGDGAFVPFDMDFLLRLTDERHAVKRNLNEVERLLRLDLELEADRGTAKGRWEILDERFPQAPAKDKTQMALTAQVDATWRLIGGWAGGAEVGVLRPALTLAAEWVRRDRRYPADALKDRTFRSLMLQGELDWGLAQLSGTATLAQTRYPNDPDQDEDKLTASYEAEAERELGAWKFNAAVSQRTIAFAPDPTRDRHDRSLDLKAEWAGHLLTATGRLTLSEARFPHNPAKDKRVMAQGVQGSWDFGDDDVEFAASFEFERETRRFTGAPLKDEALQTAQVRGIWQASPAEFTATWTRVWKYFPNDPDRDEDRVTLQFRMTADLSEGMTLTVVSELEEDRFPHRPDRDTVTAGLSIQLQVAF